MKHLKMPSPAMVLAVVALVAALGGVGYAASELAKNSVTTKQIKNKTIKGKDVKPNALGGKQIDEAKLAQVPSAASADSAGAIAGSARVWKRVAPSASAATTAVGRTAATKVPLGGGGPFTVYGKCFIETGADRVYSEIIIETTQDGGVVGGYSPDYWYGDLGPGSDEDDRTLIDTSASNDSANQYDYGDFNAIATDGTVLTGDVGAYAKHGTLASGDGAYGPGDVCIFRYEQRPVTTVQPG